MDWMRRNWPDLLIGLALVAVIAGIIATLLSGGSLLPLGRGSADTPRRVVTDPPIVTTPVNLPDTRSDDRDAQADDDDTTQTQANAAESGPGIVPVLPDIGGSELGDADPGAISGTPDAPTAGQGVSSAAGQDDARGSSGGDFALAPADRAPFRVSAGAFTVQDYAEAQVARLQDAGYPVFTGRQGDLYLVLVGPYDREGEAQQIAAELEGEGLVQGPLVYECEDCVTEGTGPADASHDTSDGLSADLPGSSATASASSAGSAGVGEIYLQVGAYPSLETSELQRERMQELGYTVTVRQESGLVKLLIGPFDGGELSAAQERLASQGIDNFPRR